MEINDRIRDAYRLTGSNSFYDGMITCSTILGRLVSRIVWDMNKEDSAGYQTQALSGIPEDFSGHLLEVPVGTGVLTMPVYQAIPNALKMCIRDRGNIWALSGALLMLGKAKENRDKSICMTKQTI